MFPFFQQHFQQQGYKKTYHSSYHSKQDRFDDISQLNIDKQESDDTACGSKPGWTADKRIVDHASFFTAVWLTAVITPPATAM
jgi:hypothetical protein